MNDTSPHDRATDPSPPAATAAGGGTGAGPSSSAFEPAGQGLGDQGEVGDALRSIYQRTIEENVPDEMLDLLGRLD